MSEVPKLSSFSGRVGAKHLHHRLGLTGSVAEWFAVSVSELGLIEGTDYGYMGEEGAAFLSEMAALSIAMVTLTPEAKRIRSLVCGRFLAGGDQDVFEPMKAPEKLVLSETQLAALTGVSVQGLRNRLTLRGLRVRDPSGGHKLTDKGKKYAVGPHWRGSVAAELGLSLKSDQDAS